MELGAAGTDRSRETLTIGELSEIVNQFVRERDWEQFHKPKNLAMSIAIEAAEIMEHFQWTDAESTDASSEASNGSNTSDSGGAANESPVAEEIADVLAYLLRLATVLGIDPGQALVAKMKKNAIKYPVGQAYEPKQVRFRGGAKRD